LVPKIRDLKKLFGGLSKNFWYGVEEDWYLGASALGVVVFDTQKNFLEPTGVIHGDTRDRRI